MKTKRRTWVVAGVVVVAILVLFVVGFTSGAWQIFAYEEVAYESPVDSEFLYLAKKWSHLPGPNIILPPQLCDRCRSFSHPACIGGVYVRFRSGTVSGFNYSPKRSVLEDWQLFTCTCPDASHKDKP